MARLVVEDSSLGRFLDELPSLVMQYKQMQYMQEERALDREERKAQRVEGILLKEYYNKLGEVKTTEAMYDKYSNLKPADVSQGGSDLISIVDEQNNISMNAITSNLDALSSYQRDLKGGLAEVSGQAQILKEMQMDFAGPEGVLQEHEYKEFREHALKSMDEGGLGWSTTAGADVEFYKTDPTSRQLQAYQVTERMQKEAQTGAAGSYAILQATFTPGENEDTGDLVDKLSYEDASGKIIKPSADVVSAIQRMSLQPDYDDFVTNLNAYPASAGGDLIRDFLTSNPNTAMVYSNLKQDVSAISTLDRELSGINESNQTTDLEHFTAGISGITDERILFGLYDQAVSGKDPALHEQFFNAIEGQLGMEDAGMAYMAFKGLAPTDKSAAELNQIQYEQDFGDFQLESLGQEGIDELRPVLEPESLRQDDMGRIHAGWETPAENLNVSLDRVDKLARLTDLSSELYQTYLNNKAEE